MSLWSQAARMAERTPASRNRYVDFLRAASIGCVVFGHWLAAAPYLEPDGELVATHVLAVSDWTQWLTWGIQVMPIFFMVGGFSNAITWQAARRAGTGYGPWLSSRLRRLVWPVLPLIVAWIGMGSLAYFVELSDSMLRAASQLAMIPIWFLAVYLGVIVLVPWSYALWERHRFGSFAGFVIGAIALDAAFFWGWQPLGWLNYLFVWSAVHQLGYAWSEGLLSGPRRTWLMGAVGLGLLIFLTSTELAPYPRAMVGVPGEAVSNTTPPKITLIALALAQAGLLLAIEQPMRRFLARAAPWTATVLVSSMIMTVYLWHMTALVLWTGFVYSVGPDWQSGIGLRLEPGTAAWWQGRPAWLGILTALLVPLVLVFSRFERPSPSAGSPPVWRLVLGALLFVVGLAYLSKDGIAGGGPFGLRISVLALPMLGAL
ncbi:acyltransferase, partial [Myxococcota bacterium]|nr:acyltransferase [Myxococcota bacterium]